MPDFPPIGAESARNTALMAAVLYSGGVAPIAEAVRIAMEICAEVDKYVTEDQKWIKGSNV